MPAEPLPNEKLFPLLTVVNNLYTEHYRMTDTAECSYVDALFEYAQTDFTSEDLRIFEVDRPKLAEAVKREADKQNVGYEESVEHLIKSFYDKAYQTILDSRES